jgi:hypothetical protein
LPFLRWPAEILDDSTEAAIFIALRLFTAGFARFTANFTVFVKIREH